MHPRTRLPLDDDDEDDDGDDDDDEGVKQQATDAIEKFVQSRHVQTLKYLRQVIDENRQLRLHVDRLKRDRQPPPSQPVVVATSDRATEVDETHIESDETPAALIDLPPVEIRSRTPEVVFCLSHY